MKCPQAFEAGCFFVVETTGSSARLRIPVFHCGTHSLEGIHVASSHKKYFTQTVDGDIMHRGSRAARRFDAGLTSRMRHFATEALPVPLVFWGVFVCPIF